MKLRSIALLLASSACSNMDTPPNRARKKGQKKQIPSTRLPLTWSKNLDQTPPSKEGNQVEWRRSTFHEDSRRWPEKQCASAVGGTRAKKSRMIYSNLARRKKTSKPWERVCSKAVLVVSGVALKCYIKTWRRERRTWNRSWKINSRWRQKEIVLVLKRPRTAVFLKRRYNYYLENY